MAGKKIIIIGLDNAGKSTILLTLKREAGLHEFANLQPTKGLQTEQFESSGLQYHIWDFGGQEKFRQMYLNKPDYFYETDSVIFVIDVQEETRFEAALGYLEEILKLMKEANEKSEFSVYFHKFDPELLDEEKYQERSKNLRKKLRQLFKQYSFEVKVYHTSIYTVFQRIQVM